MKGSAAVISKRVLRPIRKPSKREIPILVRIWHEDGVWNVSAFDLPIVVFDENLDQARSYFMEATCSHFMTLAELGRLDEIANQLIGIAKERGFYENRIKPRQLVERVDYSLDPDQSLCAAVG